jgi:hypothetical protein
MHKINYITYPPILLRKLLIIFFYFLISQILKRNYERLIVDVHPQSKINILSCNSDRITSKFIHVYKNLVHLAHCSEKGEYFQILAQSLETNKLPGSYKTALPWILSISTRQSMQSAV